MKRFVLVVALAAGAAVGCSQSSPGPQQQRGGNQDGKTDGAGGSDPAKWQQSGNERNQR